MIISMMVEVFIKAFLLCILIYIVAREEADYDFRKVLMVTAGVLFGAVILDATLTRYIGLLTLLPIAVLVVFMVMQFCWLRFWQALLVAVPFIILNIMISGAATSFQTKANAAISRGMQGPISDEDMKIALSFYQDGGRTNELLAAMENARTKAPPVEDTLEQVIFKTIRALFSSNQPPFKTLLAGKIAGRIPPSFLAAPEPVVMEIKAPRPENNAADQEAIEQEWAEASKQINARGTLVGTDGVRVAVVNNQLVKEGELIQVEHRKMIYRWRLKIIRANRISWEPAEVFKK
jgi:hypothetical protein